MVRFHTYSTDTSKVSVKAENTRQCSDSLFTAVEWNRASKAPEDILMDVVIDPTCISTERLQSSANDKNVNIWGGLQRT